MQGEWQGPLGRAVFPAAPVPCGEQLFRAEGEKEAESTPSPGGPGRSPGVDTTRGKSSVLFM